MINRIVVDIDWVLCKNWSHKDYLVAEPIKENIDAINSYEGEVVIQTARLSEDRKVTEEWLFKNNVKYSKLIMDKISADLYIDDKATRFIPNISEEKDDRKELVICVSGGMDSVLAYEYAIREKWYKREDILCINFDLWHPYYQKEQYYLNKAHFEYKTIKLGLCNKSLWTMPTKENYIIPGRNMVFASVAASFGKRVWIVWIKFENHYKMQDKNAVFFDLASLATTQAIGKKTIIESPFIEMSKTDCIKWALDSWVNPTILSNTTSCYDPKRQRCGNCWLCFKRYIAWQAAWLVETFDVNPTTTKIAQDFLDNYLVATKEQNFSHYHKERILETATILAAQENETAKEILTYL